MEIDKQASVDADWLLNNPDKTLGSQYHDAGSCWQLIDAFRYRFILLREAFKQHWDHMGYNKDDRKFEAAPMEQRAMLMIDDLRWKKVDQYRHAIKEIESGLSIHLDTASPDLMKRVIQVTREAADKILKEAE